MRILVFEYVTGGGLRAEPLPRGLLREGESMLRGLLADLLGISGIHLLVPRDDRLPTPLPGDVRLQWIPVGAGPGYGPAWHDGLQLCDAVWPIAPETGGILERLCRDAESAGKPLLTSGSSAVRLAASKKATTDRLTRADVPAVPTFRWEETPADLSYPRVIKPDDGVGCEGLAIFPEARRWPEHPPHRNSVVQPWLDGDTLSLSVLFHHGRAQLLSCNRLELRHRGEGLVLTACRVNAFADRDGSWQDLAAAIGEAVPELWGYVGIDLVATTTGPCVLEINPRLTTSYAGIRTATGVNPAALVLQRLGWNGLQPLATSATGCVRVRPGVSLGH